MRYSPYPVPQRAVRSVSPARSALVDVAMRGLEDEEGMEMDEDGDEEVEFWGGVSPRERGGKGCQGCEGGSGDEGVGDEGNEEEDEGMEDEDVEDEDEGEEGEEDDYMAIYGHR